MIEKKYVLDRIQELIGLLEELEEFVEELNFFDPDEDDEDER